MQYIGRFAPSPTGPLHFGSLVAAVASYCDAKANQGKWLLRIENVDTTREVTGATEAIIDCLAAYGFVWDSEILVQDQRSDIYQRYLNQLIDKEFAYPCTCTRKQIAEMKPKTGIEGFIYPGTCLQKPPTTQNCAWRMQLNQTRITFNDRMAGTVRHDMPNDIGDFILKRADGIYSYHLAVVIDDALQGITHVVRGEDLLHSTSRQLTLQKALGLATPSYMHIPIVKNNDGEKLSKQTLAEPIQHVDAVSNLVKAFSFLNFNPPKSLGKKSLQSVWQWGIENWPYRVIV